ncbi:MAG: glycosyltransferase family 39 protein [Verrucomicrobiota bacterium]
MAKGKQSFSYFQWSLVIIVALTLFRLWFVNRMELVGDEAYYWLWSKHLDWSYFSKGPGVAYTIAAGTELFGDTVLGVRFFAVILSACTAVCLFWLGSQLFSPKIGFWCVITAAVIPLFSLGSILMTIDPLSVFFWVLAANAFWRAKERNHWSCFFWWLLTGLSIGLGMLCKYTNVAQLACFFLFCLWDRKGRHCFLTIGFWLMLVVIVACLYPVYRWNEANEWITLEHLIHRGGLDESFEYNVGEVLAFWVMQAVVISPFIWLAMLAAVFLTKGSNDHEKTSIRYAITLFLPLLLFYSVLSLKEAGEANWAVPSYIGGILLVVVCAMKLSEKWKGVRYVTGLVLGIALVGSLLLHDVPGASEIKPIRRLLNRAKGSEDLAEQVNLLQREYGASFLIANKYSYASLLSFYAKNNPRVYLPSHEGIMNQYSFWSGYEDGFWRETALFVSDSDDIPVQLTREFSEVMLVKESYTYHEANEIRKFYFFVCEEFGGREDTVELLEVGEQEVIQGDTD